MKDISVCFVAPDVYPVLAGLDYGKIGGAEVQQALLAKALAGKGLRVSAVVGDFGQPLLKEIDGVRTVRAYRLHHGNRKLRFLFDQAKLFRAMRIADADIYYQRCIAFYTGQVSLFCRMFKRKFVFSAGHDYNYDPEHSRIFFNPLIRWGYMNGLRNADGLLCQSERQMELLKGNYGRGGVLIRNGCEIKDGPAGKNGEPFVLWVGNLASRKRPEVFVRLAAELPGVRFKMIGGPFMKEKDRSGEMAAKAANLPNLDYLGFLPYGEADGYFRDAALLVNTSASEGFPNTFLQAWSYGTPVVSLGFDPDEVICRHGLGLHPRSFGGLLKDVEKIISDKALREEFGKNCLLHVRKHHDIGAVAERCIEFFESLTP